MWCQREGGKEAAAARVRLLWGRQMAEARWKKFMIAQAGGGSERVGGGSAASSKLKEMQKAAGGGFFNLRNPLHMPLNPWISPI